MSRVFLSHSRFDSRQAVAVKQWLIEQESGLVDEAILCARLEPLPDANITSEWHHCDLFPDPPPLRRTSTMAGQRRFDHRQRFGRHPGDYATAEAGVIGWRKPWLMRLLRNGFA
jgi:hypothetical protein